MSERNIIDVVLDELEMNVREKKGFKNMLSIVKNNRENSINDNISDQISKIISGVIEDENIIN